MKTSESVTVYCFALNPAFIFPTTFAEGKKISRE